MIKMLGDVLEKEEENKNYDNLLTIFSIFKNILLISNQNIIEMFVHDDFFQTVFGALECNSIPSRGIEIQEYI
jgi:hypothetical protein